MCLQQNQIMNLFVDDCSALTGHDLSGEKSDSHLKVLDFS